MKPEEIKRIRQEVAEFLVDTYPEITQCELAEIFGVSQPSVSKWFRDSLLEVERGVSRSERKRLVLRLAEENPEMTQVCIASRIGISQPMVSRWLKEKKKC